ETPLQRPRGRAPLSGTLGRVLSRFRLHLGGGKSQRSWMERGSLHGVDGPAQDGGDGIEPRHNRAPRLSDAAKARIACALVPATGSGPPRAPTRARDLCLALFPHSRGPQPHVLSRRGRDSTSPLGDREGACRKGRSSPTGRSFFPSL